MEKVKIIDSKKFMWDGRIYSGKSDAEAMKAKYESNDFDIRMIHEEKEYFLFTRKVVTEIVVEPQL